MFFTCQTSGVCAVRWFFAGKGPTGAGGVACVGRGKRCHEPPATNVLLSLPVGPRVLVQRSGGRHEGPALQGSGGRACMEPHVLGRAEVFGLQGVTAAESPDRHNSWSCTQVLVVPPSWAS